jgi:hypothetical protein
MKLEVAYRNLSELRRIIGNFEDQYGYLPDDFEVRDSNNDEECFRCLIALSIVSHLNEIKYILDWIDKPVKAKGYLVKDSTGRYEISNTDYCFTSGYPLEVFHNEDNRWYKSRIEHNGEDYYIACLGRNTPIEGLLVRTR